MAVADAQRWDARYAGRAPTVPSPPDVLVAADMVDLVGDPGRALDVACGPGSQSLWLAQRGFDVVAVDASDAAITLVAEAVEAAGLTDRVDARVLDLDSGIPIGLGDFDVIVCQRFRGIDLYDSFVTRLRSGGVAVITVLSQAGADASGPFHAPSGELLDAFTRPDAEILFHDEANGQESIILRRP
jgi:SAM-dependent methyltransferase